MSVYIKIPNPVAINERVFDQETGMTVSRKARTMKAAGAATVSPPGSSLIGSRDP